MGHIRLLSWLLIGTLTNNCISGSLCQSVPQEVSCYIADHVQVVLTGYPDHAKTSVVHMSSLFHTFVLCQVSKFFSLDLCKWFSLFILFFY